MPEVGESIPMTAFSWGGLGRKNSFTMRGEKRLIYKDLIGFPEVNTRQPSQIGSTTCVPVASSPIRGGIVTRETCLDLGNNLEVFGSYSTRNFRNETLKDLKVIRLSTCIFPAPRDLDLALLMFRSRRLENLKR